MNERKNKFKSFRRFRKQKKIYENKLFWIFISLFLIVFALFYFLCFYDLFQIKEINIVGNEKIQTIDLLRIIDSSSENEIFSYPTKSIFLFDIPSVINEIYAKFPQADKANLKREFPSVLTLEIEERIAAAIFSQNDQDFFIDEKGIAFEKIDKINNFKIKKQGVDYDLELGSKVINEELVSKIINIATTIERDLGIKLREFLIVSEEILNIKTQEGWNILLDPQRDLDWQLTKLKTDLTQEIPAERRESLEYIDVRFGNFAPYKYKD